MLKAAATRQRKSCCITIAAILSTVLAGAIAVYAAAADVPEKFLTVDTGGPMIVTKPDKILPALPPCPDTPNCVSSQDSGSRHIEPLKFSGNAQSAFDKLRKLLARRTDTKIISADDAMIRVEFKTMLGFVDEGLFLLDGAGDVIQVRSAARLGYWDLGKNRRRMEEIRQSFLMEINGR